MVRFTSSIKKLKAEERKIHKVIRKIKFKSNRKLAYDVVNNITTFLNVAEGGFRTIPLIRFKIEVAADMAQSLIKAHWGCIEVLLKSSAMELIYPDLYQKIAQIKQKRILRIKKERKFFQEKAESKIVNALETAPDDPPNEERRLEREDRLSVLRDMGRPSAMLPFEDTILRHENLLAPPTAPLHLQADVSLGIPRLPERTNLTIEEPVIPVIQALDEFQLNRTGITGEPEVLPAIQAPEEQTFNLTGVMREPVYAEALPTAQDLTLGFDNPSIPTQVLPAHGQTVDDIAQTNTSTTLPQCSRIEANMTVPLANPNDVAPSHGGAVPQVPELDSFVEDRSRREPNVVEPSQRAELVDADAIPDHAAATVRTPNVVPETPDSDIHPQLEPVTASQLAKAPKKNKTLKIDKRTKILDYAQRAVRLNNQQQFYRSPILNDAPNTLSKIQQDTLNRLFRRPAGSSESMAHALTKLYERHLITKLISSAEINGVFFPIPIARQPSVSRDLPIVTSRQAEIEEVLPNEPPIDAGLAQGEQTLSTHVTTALTDPRNDIVLPIQPEMEVVDQQRTIVSNATSDFREQQEAMVEEQRRQNYLATNINNVLASNLANNLHVNEELGLEEERILIATNLMPSVTDAENQRQNDVDVAPQVVQNIPPPLQLETSANQLRNVETVSFGPEETVQNIQPLLEMLHFETSANETRNMETVNRFTPRGEAGLQELIQNIPPPLEMLPVETSAIEPRNIANENGISTLNGIRVVPMDRLTNRNLNESAGPPNAEVATSAQGDEENANVTMMESTNLPPRNKFRSMQYVFERLLEIWTHVEMISMSDFLDTDNSPSNQVVLLKTLLRLNEKWMVQLDKMFDTVVIAPFNYLPENLTE